MPNPNELLVWGWNVQGAGYANQSVNGVPGQGYAQAGNAPAAAAVSAAMQPSGGGLPYPVGAENVQGETGDSGAGFLGVLTNPVYAGNPANVIPGALTPPSIPATTVAAFNPSGLEAQVSITGGTVTVISVAAAGSSTYTQVGTTTPAVVQVPGGGSIKLTYSVIPTSWTWVAVN